MIALLRDCAWLWEGGPRARRGRRQYAGVRERDWSPLRAESGAAADCDASAPPAMATLGLSKVFILDKYFTELQRFWETEKKLQACSEMHSRGSEARRDRPQLRLLRYIFIMRAHCEAQRGVQCAGCDHRLVVVSLPSPAGASEQLHYFELE
ncbi:hypothetical protein PYW08_013660 [Mythimna loreyi]|uniref:Uncharacterized protein n=1 Tax=Mythimna loreyi TaxID=667449 RepID=A0ACC2QGB0_9NEOP|nr:hypothetical protein PYW08_013660 [Mythimna loreyi]